VAKFQIVAEVEQADLKLSGVVKVSMLNLQDSDESPSWKREAPTATFSLEDATLANLITAAFSTPLLVRWQAKARKCTAQEIDAFIATPAKVVDLLTTAERKPLTAEEVAGRLIADALAGKLAPEKLAEVLAALTKA
jgi:hypothetical protein